MKRDVRILLLGEGRRWGRDCARVGTGAGLGLAYGVAATLAAALTCYPAQPRWGRRP